MEFSDPIWVLIPPPSGLALLAEAVHCRCIFLPVCWREYGLHRKQPPSGLSLSITDMDTGRPMWDMPEEKVPELGTVMNHLHLLSPLIGGSELYLSGAEEERAKALQLIRYGANSAASWIGNKKDSSDPPLFGVADLAFILGAIKTPGDRVEVLQRIWQSHGSPSEGCIIHFRRDDNTWGCTCLWSTKSATSGKRNWREYESEMYEAESIKIPDDEDWIFVSSKPDGPQFGSVSGQYYSCDLPESMNDKLYGYSFGSFLRDEPKLATPVIWDLVLGNHGLAGIYTRRG